MIILRVLSHHPGGRTTLAAMKADIGVLVGSRDFTARMRALGACFPDLDIFSQGYIVRDNAGWQITRVGREFLASIEISPNQPAVTVVIQSLTNHRISKLVTHTSRSHPRRRYEEKISSGSQVEVAIA